MVEELNKSGRAVERSPLPEMWVLYDDVIKRLAAFGRDYVSRPRSPRQTPLFVI